MIELRITKPIGPCRPAKKRWRACCHGLSAGPVAAEGFTRALLTVALEDQGLHT